MKTAIIFGKLAELWRKDYVDNPKVKLATPTREKYRTRLDNHILPRWKDSRLADLNDTKAVLDWLQHECSSWYMMVDLRNIMSGIITRAQVGNHPPVVREPDAVGEGRQEVDGAPGAHPRR